MPAIGRRFAMKAALKNILINPDNPINGKAPRLGPGHDPRPETGYPDRPGWTLAVISRMRTREAWRSVVICAARGSVQPRPLIKWSDQPGYIARNCRGDAGVRSRLCS